MTQPAQRSDAAAAAAMLRSAFGRFVTGVVVVTAPRAAGGWAAVTVNSFTSVSLDPPLVLWCLGIDSNCREHFQRAGRFAINVLRHDQQTLSNVFARPSACNWDAIPVSRSPRGNGLIQGAIATFECSEHSSLHAGDHLVFIGRIEDFTVGGPEGPLAFYKGGYGSFTADQSAGAAWPAEAVAGEELSLGWG